MCPLNVIISQHLARFGEEAVKVDEAFLNEKVMPVKKFYIGHPESITSDRFVRGLKDSDLSDKVRHC